MGNGFLKGAVVFFARGSGWARDAAASAAEEATAPSGPCAGGWRHPGPAAAPGGTDPGPRRPGGGRTRRPSSSGSSTSPDGPTGCRRIRAGPARSGVEASRSAWSAGSWRQRVRLPVGPRGRAGTDRAGAGSSGPAGWPGRRRRRARDETGGRHRAWSGPAGIRPPGGRRGLHPGGGVVGRAIAGRMRAGLVAGASAMAVPGPSADPWCHGPPLGSGGSMHAGRMHGIHDRPRNSPVRRADRWPLWQCRRRVVHRGLEEGTREPWGPLDPRPCVPGRDSPDRVTMRSRASPLGDRPPDPRPSRHRMETTTQDSSPRPTINHCLKNLHHSTLLGQDVRRDRDPQRGSG